MLYGLFLFGRCLLGGFFIFNAYVHFKNRTSLAQYAHSRGVPAAEPMVFISGIMLLFGGVAIVGNIYPLIGMWLLIGFLVPTTYMVHNFWRHKGTERMIEQIHFLKNCALIGALIMIITLSSVFLLR